MFLKIYYPEKKMFKRQSNVLNVSGRNCLLGHGEDAEKNGKK
jgi:hypothetical protein